MLLDPSKRRRARLAGEVLPLIAGPWPVVADRRIGEDCVEKHRQLKQYTVCLPVNRPDSRRDDQTSFLERWNERVRKWEAWATTNAMVVTFVFWGDHEIGLRLTGKAHRGRLFYWFNHEKLSDRWFSERAEEAVSNVGPRYTPHLNVTLPVARLFDGLGRTERFYSRIGSPPCRCEKTLCGADVLDLILSRSRYDRSATDVFSWLPCRAEAIDRAAKGPIDFPALVQKIDEVQDLGRACVGSLHAAGDATDCRRAKSSESSANGIAFCPGNSTCFSQPPRLQSLLRGKRGLAG